MTVLSSSSSLELSSARRHVEGIIMESSHPVQDTFPPGDLSSGADSLTPDIYNLG